MILIGFQFYTFDNRFGVTIEYSKPDGTTDDSWWVRGRQGTNNSDNCNHEGGVQNLFIDINSLWTNGWVARGIQL